MCSNACAYICEIHSDVNMHVAACDVLSVLMSFQRHMKQIFLLFVEEQLYSSDLNTRGKQRKGISSILIDAERTERGLYAIM